MRWALVIRRRPANAIRLNFSCCSPRMQASVCTRYKMRRLLFCVVFAFGLSVEALAEKCPSPTEQLKTDVKGKIEGELATLLKLGKLNTVGDVETKTQEFFHLYPDANRAALEQNTLSIICNNVLLSPQYSQQFKEEIVKKLLEKILGDPKKINWKAYKYEFTGNSSPDSVLSAPSAITIAYPDDWLLRTTDPEMGLVVSPGPTADYGDYQIQFKLEVMGTTAEGLIGNLAGRLKTPEYPISAEISDYQRFFNIEREVEARNLPGVSVSHAYKAGKIKVDTGSNFEQQSILFDIAVQGSRMSIASLYASPFSASSTDSLTASSTDSRDVLVSRFQCDVPRLFDRLCGWLFSRIVVHGSTALAD
jgi:hypothetical protein